MLEATLNKTTKEIQNVNVDNEIIDKLDTLTELEENILSTTLKYFEEKGYYNGNVEDIAKEIGIGKGTIYRHFGNKFHLLCYTLSFAMYNAYKQLKRLVDEDDPYLALSTYITEALDISKSFVNIRKTSAMEITYLYMKELSESPDFIRSIIYMSRICATDILAPIMKKCADKNNIEINELFVSQFISTFIDAFSNIICAAKFLEKHYGREQKVLQLTDNPEQREAELKRFLFRAIGTPENIIKEYLQ